jgi:hypothetical protein
VGAAQDNSSPGGLRRRRVAQVLISRRRVSQPASCADSWPEILQTRSRGTCTINTIVAFYKKVILLDLNRWALKWIDLPADQ